MLSEDATITRERGDDIEGKTETRTGVGVANLSIRIFEPLSLSAVGRVVWGDMVT